MCTGYGVMLDSEFSPLKGVVVRGDIAGCRCGVSIGGHRNHELTHVLLRNSLVENNQTGVAVANAKHVFLDALVIRGNERAGLSFGGRRLSADVVVSDTNFQENGKDVADVDRVVRSCFLRNQPPETNDLGGRSRTEGYPFKDGYNRSGRRVPRRGTD